LNGVKPDVAISGIVKNKNQFPCNALFNFFKQTMSYLYFTHKARILLLVLKHNPILDKTAEFTYQAFVLCNRFLHCTIPFVCFHYFNAFFGGVPEHFTRCFNIKLISSGKHDKELDLFNS